MTELMDALRKRIPDAQDRGCFMCRLILEDLSDGKLTGALLDFFKNPGFPKSGMLAHLKLEGIPFWEGDL